MAATDKNMTFDVNLLPATTGDHNLGSSDKKWNLYIDKINGKNLVTGVKGSAQSNYSTGDVSLSAANVGAVATSGNETVEGNKTFSGTTNLNIHSIFNIPQNTVISTNTAEINQSPIPKYLWHDIWAFNKVVTPKYYITNDGTNWTEATLENYLFSHKMTWGQSQIINSQIKGSRWVWETDRFAYSSAKWLVIGIAYGGATNARFDLSLTIENSSGTITELANLENQYYSATPIWIKTNTPSSIVKTTLTITRNASDTTTNVLPITSLQWLASRWGNQGQGSELEYPYQWDYNWNIYPLANNTQNLGTSSVKWANIYATNLVGNADTATAFSTAKEIKLTGDVTGSASSTGGWSISTKTNYLSNKSRPTSANIVSTDYLSKCFVFLATSNMSEGKPREDGIITHFSWDNNLWAGQLYIPANKVGAMQWRGSNNATDGTNWGDWITLLDEVNARSLLGVTDNSNNTDVTSSDTNLITGRTLYYQLAKKGYTTNTGTVTSITPGNGLINGTSGSNQTAITGSGTISIGDGKVTNAMLAGAITRHKLELNVVKTFNRTDIGTSPNYDDPGINGLFEIRISSEATGESGTRPFDGFGSCLSLKTPDNIAMLQLSGSLAGYYIRAKQSPNVTMANRPWEQIVTNSGTWGISISGTAAKATKDADGLNISTNYLKLSGGTMTGLLTLKTNLVLKNDNVTINTTTNNGNTGSNPIFKGINVNDSTNTWYGQWHTAVDPDGTLNVYLNARNKKTDGTEVINALIVGVKKDGTRYYQVSDAAAFRSALGLGSNATSSTAYLPLTGGTITGDLVCKSSIVDASKTNNNITGTTYLSLFTTRDCANRGLGRIESIIQDNGNIGLYLYVKNYDTSGAQVQPKGILMTMNKSGALTYTISDKANFAAALDPYIYYVTQSTTTTANWRKIMLGKREMSSPNTALAAINDVVYGAQAIEAQPSTGTLRANIYRVANNVELQWNSTDSSLDFVFI